VIAAVSMGARVVEKHFTDNNYRTGPDHKFSMNPKTWKKMVSKVRILEEAIGNGKKKIELNETESAIIQRRGIWLIKDVKKNQKLRKEDIDILRPCPSNSISPFIIDKYLGKKFKQNLKAGSLLTKKCLKV
jgi:sialic acid synthase SpsE